MAVFSCSITFIGHEQLNIFSQITFEFETGGLTTYFTNRCRTSRLVILPSSVPICQIYKAKRDNDMDFLGLEQSLGQSWVTKKLIMLKKWLNFGMIEGLKIHNEVVLLFSGNFSLHFISNRCTYFYDNFNTFLETKKWIKFAQILAIKVENCHIVQL